MPAEGPQQASDSSAVVQKVLRSCAVLLFGGTLRDVRDVSAHKQPLQQPGSIVEGFPCSGQSKGQLCSPAPPAPCCELCLSLAVCLCTAVQQDRCKQAEQGWLEASPCTCKSPIVATAPTRVPARLLLALPPATPAPPPCSRRSRRPRCWAAACSLPPCLRT